MTPFEIYYNDMLLVVRLVGVTLIIGLFCILYYIYYIKPNRLIDDNEYQIKKSETGKYYVYFPNKGYRKWLRYEGKCFLDSSFNLADSFKTKEEAEKYAKMYIKSITLTDV